MRWMRVSRAVRTAGVGRKSYLSSGTLSAMPRTRLRVLSQVAFVGARKLVAGDLDGAPGGGPPGVWAIPGVAQRTTSTAATARRTNVSLVMGHLSGDETAAGTRPFPARGDAITPTVDSTERARGLGVDSCAVGSRGGRCLSLGGYITGTGPRVCPPPEGTDVAYARSADRNSAPGRESWSAARSSERTRSCRV